jgi:predicted acyl esterase
LSHSVKYLRTIVGRHDLPFYLNESVDLQLGWFGAWLKGNDRVGWTRKGEVPAVNVVPRKGNVGVNNTDAERAYKSGDENERPIARTQYTKFYLGINNTLKQERTTHQGEVSYRAPSDIDNQQLVQFISDPFLEEVEITGHSVAHLNVSVTQDINGPAPSDIDLFVTLRYIGLDGKEVYYTGTVGDLVPLAKGWLRVSLRQVNKENTQHRGWLPYRDHTSKSSLPVRPGEVYPVDVEIWPTNVVAEKGGKIVLEVASGDTQGAGLFLHNDPEDR